MKITPLYMNFEASYTLNHVCQAVLTSKLDTNIAN